MDKHVGPIVNFIAEMSELIFCSVLILQCVSDPLFMHFLYHSGRGWSKGGGEGGGA